jgi:hypothetical protein
MTHYETVEAYAAVAFSKLPRRSSREAQDAHKLAKAIAVAIVEEQARIDRVEASAAHSPTLSGYERPLEAGSETNISGDA